MDSLPSKVFIRCDDFTIRSNEKTVAALTALMDLTSGYFSIKKINPPSQEAKYCGFIYDTRAIPTIRIPLDSGIALCVIILGRREKVSSCPFRDDRPASIHGRCVPSRNG
jgi:hypothetical protein